jgi:hypothetical protein
MFGLVFKLAIASLKRRWAVLFLFAACCATVFSWICLQRAEEIIRLEFTLRENPRLVNGLYFEKQTLVTNLHYAAKVRVKNLGTAAAWRTGGLTRGYALLAKGRNGWSDVTPGAFTTEFLPVNPGEWVEATVTLPIDTSAWRIGMTCHQESMSLFTRYCLGWIESHLPGDFCLHYNCAVTEDVDFWGPPWAVSEAREEVGFGLAFWRY